MPASAGVTWSDASPRSIYPLTLSTQSSSAHDHGDHTKGAGVFSRRHGTPVYLTERTLAACSRLFRGTEPTVTYRAGRHFEVGSIRVEPFLTVHDAADPVAVALVDTTTETRVGVATDLGRPNAQIRLALSGADFLILEANHDEELLRTGPYPWAVQQRIASSHGHLSNHAAARFACELLHPRLAGVLLAHLSQECNRPELAEAVVGDALPGRRLRRLPGSGASGAADRVHRHRGAATPHRTRTADVPLEGWPRNGGAF